MRKWSKKALPTGRSRLKSLKTLVFYDKIARLVGGPVTVFPAFCAEVAELVDALDLGSSVL